MSYVSGYGGPWPLTSTEGVLGRRLVAYGIDLVVITLLTLLFGFLIGIAGVLTFGAAWLLYGILVPATAILYSAATVGGAGRGTLGMRMAGLQAVDAGTGAGLGPLIAGLHAFLFYVAIPTGVLLILDILIGFARQDSRVGHDLVTGVIVVRR